MSQRSNVWCFVIYPDDSAPSNYLEIIRSWHIPALVSPVHDSDFNADDTEKKKHIHVLLYFGVGANKSFDQVKVYTDQLFGTIPIRVNSVNAMIRYFIHKDNPEKHQYRKEDLIVCSGFEIGNAFDNFSDQELMYEQLEKIIVDNGIYNMFNLVVFLKDYNMKDELRFLRSHTYYIKAVLDGRYQLLNPQKSK